MTRSAAGSAIRIGISSCLLGEEVRYDGGHNQDRFITSALTPFFKCVSVCPELAIGLGVPREPIQLRGSPQRIRVVGTVTPDLDVTDQLREYGARMAQELSDISGYIFKSRSPSCGMERVKLYSHTGSGAPNREGAGQFADAFMHGQPVLPVEEEGQLCDPVLRENFIERVFTYKRWQDMIKRGVTAKRLIDFHARHKFSVLAHGNRAYTQLGRLVAGAGERHIDEVAGEYITGLMSALKKCASRKGHTDVLQHLQGYLKPLLDAEDKAEMVGIIDEYRLGRVPLVVPITLLRHHFRKYPNPYVDNQVYLNPHPKELMLRNLI